MKKVSCWLFQTVRHWFPILYEPFTQISQLNSFTVSSLQIGDYALSFAFACWLDCKQRVGLLLQIVLFCPSASSVLSLNLSPSKGHKSILCLEKSNSKLQRDD